MVGGRPRPDLAGAVDRDRHHYGRGGDRHHHEWGGGGAPAPCPGWP